MDSQEWMVFVIDVGRCGLMNRLCNWKVIFEYEDGTTVEMHRVLDHRDEEHIDSEISAVIQEAGLWEDNNE